MTGAVGFVRNGGHDQPPTTSSLFCGTPIHQTHSFRPTQQASTQQAQSDSSPYTQESPTQEGTNRRVPESERRPIHAAYTTRPSGQTHLDGRGQGGTQTTRGARDHIAGACCCESLWLGGCMGGRRKRNVEEANKEALVGFCLCPCADCEPDHSLPSLWAAFRRTGSWPGRSCRGWAVLCGW